ncbi:hypothetical protein FDB39_17435 [Clostridium botulinum]|nr:hypothetical protein [Clostridium botulinum]
MVVRNNIAKLNDNNCRNIVEYMNSGLSALESFNLEFKKNRHNPYKIKGLEIRNDKWFWIFKVYEMELNEIQSIQPC